MKILFGVTSSIAVYKSLDVISALRKKGHEIKVILTANALKMVSTIPFYSLTNFPVAYDEFKERDYIPHISLSDWADVFVVVPATANIIGKMANGIGDDLLSTTYLAFNKKILVAPAMNVKMYEHEVVQKNIQILSNRGVHFVEPATGLLACGYEGKGKLAPVSELVAAIDQMEEKNKPLMGKKVVVTAGGTIEDIDPVRYITNRSSGRMGFAFAETAYKMGADVVLIYANTKSTPPHYYKSIAVRSARQMLESLKEEVKDCDILIKSAAVADYRVKEIADKKIKKKNSDDSLTLQLIKNPDILKELSKNKKESQVFVGFALETDNLIKNATKKLKEKKLDLIIANTPRNFDSTLGEVKILYPDGKLEEISENTKEAIAKTVFVKITENELIL